MTSLLYYYEKHESDYGVIFVGICIKQICFFESVEYDMEARISAA